MRSLRSLSPRSTSPSVLAGLTVLTSMAWDRRDRFRVNLFMDPSGRLCDQRTRRCARLDQAAPDLRRSDRPRLRRRSDPGVGRPFAADDPRPAPSSRALPGRASLSGARVHRDARARSASHHPLVRRRADRFVESDHDLLAASSDASQTPTRDLRKRGPTRHAALRQRARRRDPKIRREAPLRRARHRHRSRASISIPSENASTAAGSPSSHPTTTSRPRPDTTRIPNTARARRHTRRRMLNTRSAPETVRLLRERSRLGVPDRCRSAQPPRW